MLPIGEGNPNPKIRIIGKEIGGGNPLSLITVLMMLSETSNRGQILSATS